MVGIIIIIAVVTHYEICSVWTVLSFLLSPCLECSDDITVFLSFPTP